MISSKFCGFNVHLIESLDELQFIKNNLSVRVHVGADTETSGLDFYKDDIAGVCLSCGLSYDINQYHGFYLPIRHLGYKNNLPINDVMNFTQWVIDNYVTVWWNRDFDATMLEKEGINFPCVGKTHDGQCMAHLVKGDAYPALKDFAHDYLKIDVIHFSDNEAENNNFKTTDPTVSYVYAAQDPIITAFTARKLWANYPHIRKIYPIDNKFAECMRKIMYTTDLYLDHEMVERALQKNAVELQSVKNQIFSLVGYQFKLDSNVDKADALNRFVTLTAKTAKGQFKVDKEVLQGIDHPLAQLLLKYANLNKFRGTYLLKMQQFPQPFHINYQHCNVATGRMSSGGMKGNSFFAPFNIQNVPKVEVFRYLHYASVSAELKYILDDSPYCSLHPDMPISTEGGEVKLRDLQIGQKVNTSKGLVEVQDCGKLGTKLKVYEGTKFKVNDEWVYMEPLEGEPWFLDLGEDVYSVNNGEHDVQIRTLMKAKAKGGMRDCFVCPEGYVWISEDYCLDPESVVMTSRGNVKVCDLQEGDLVYTPWGYKRCFNVRYTGKRKVVKIKLKSGEVLRCSTEHKICVKRDGELKWVKAGELKNTDYIFNINSSKYIEDHGITSTDIQED